MFTGSGFAKRLESKSCDQANHGYYTLINTAMNVCISDPNCFAVYDDVNGARLCNLHPKKIEVSGISHIYIRDGSILKDIFITFNYAVIGKCKPICLFNITSVFNCPFFFSIPDGEGWDNWQPWEKTCTTYCGSSNNRTQPRKRTCRNLQPNNKTCVGSDTEYRECGTNVNCSKL